MTTVILPDAPRPHEPAYMLLETQVWRPAENCYHRVQYIWVARDNKLRRYDEDLGVWSGLPLRVLGLMEETVATLRGIAERERGREASDGEWQKHMDELAAESTLIKRAVYIAESSKTVLYNRSSFGAFVNKQRNGVPQAAQQAYERRQA